METITFTKKALEELSKAKQEHSIPDDHFLRIGAHRNTSDTVIYGLTFVENKEEHDIVWEHESIKFCIDRPSLFYVEGKQIDYRYDQKQYRSGFIFEDAPHEKEKV